MPWPQRQQQRQAPRGGSGYATSSPNECHRRRCVRLPPVARLAAAFLAVLFPAFLAAPLAAFWAVAFRRVALLAAALRVVAFFVVRRGAAALLRAADARARARLRGST